MRSTKHMRRICLLCFAAALCLLYPNLVQAQGSGQDPGDKDTVFVDRISKVNPDEKVEVKVWLWYDENIDSLAIPLTFWDERNYDIVCDSVIFSSVVEGDTGSKINNEPDVKKILMWATTISEPHIVPPLRVILATIYLHTGPDWDSEEPVVIDTTTFETKTIHHFKFFQHGASRIEWVPLFFEGVLETRKISETETPKDFTLSQNYPNPFNAVTAIEFSLRCSGQVSLGVYNILGQKVKTFYENANLSAGTYSANWYATDETGKMASSGIYFYRLSVTDVDNKQIFSAVRRMVFLK